MQKCEEKNAESIAVITPPHFLNNNKSGNGYMTMGRCETMGCREEQDEAVNDATSSITADQLTPEQTITSMKNEGKNCKFSFCKDTYLQIIPQKT